jgi:hypothetical protein
MTANARAASRSRQKSWQGQYNPVERESIEQWTLVSSWMLCPAAHDLGSKVIAEGLEWKVAKNTAHAVSRSRQKSWRGQYSQAETVLLEEWTVASSSIAPRRSGRNTAGSYDLVGERNAQEMTLAILKMMQ